ncbi:organic hydroperoxide resistance protein [Salinithrix halophila]|uniref:Organic hydroperoxide resistance protein n=1 Tax=Salinithrix halophila TaxID=1485204 RepID=A0ABV8JIP5_9BACL
MKPQYTARATTVGGRDGRVKSSDGILDLNISMPKEMGGSGGQATNPEQLFAAGYSACFGSALALVARKHKVTLDKDPEITADVSIGKDDADGGFKLAVKLTVKIPGVSHKEAQKLVKAAHEVCPYSKATRGNIDVQLEGIGS